MGRGLLPGVRLRGEHDHGRDRDGRSLRRERDRTAGPVHLDLDGEHRVGARLGVSGVAHLGERAGGERGRGREGGRVPAVGRDRERVRRQRGLALHRGVGLDEEALVVGALARRAATAAADQQHDGDEADDADERADREAGDRRRDLVRQLEREHGHVRAAARNFTGAFERAQTSKDLEKVHHRPGH